MLPDLAGALNPCAQLVDPLCRRKLLIVDEFIQRLFSHEMPRYCDYKTKMLVH